MNNFETSIGKNIREVRLASRISQETLAWNCGFSNTTLSAYENGRKIPNLTTIAKIAKQLNVSIERLYYGDENSAFISSEINEGKKVVNSIFFLWESGIISYYENFTYEKQYGISENVQPKGVYLYLHKYEAPIKRFINSLNEFREQSDTYQNPDQYLEMLKSSVATEINKMIEK